MAAGTGEASLILPVRTVRFAAVGTLCYLVQLGLLLMLDHVMHLYYADVVAFLLSAQLNFVLSLLFTWADRQRAERPLVRWVKFNASALLSVAVVNVMVFYLLVHAGLWLWAAMLIANIASTVWTFVMNHFVVFKAEPQQQILDDSGEDCHVNAAHS
jgi:putative flippase GtrA